MLETATTTEMHRHYACAHAQRADAFRAALVWLVGLLHHAKRPRLAARPLAGCATC
ncbi:hypothetical protein [Marimonas arenosa]|uniref:hypothetical protein n=1 Tax=Marimonas arenosa TaxID=1795305 RepID=UPI0027D2BCC5|nr:hypothetical protein [Marimonas arenosa]